MSDRALTHPDGNSAKLSRVASRIANQVAAAEVEARKRNGHGRFSSQESANTMG